MKAEITDDYKKCMQGVDMKGQELHYYHPCRKTLIWTEGFVTFLLQVDALNSFIFFKKIHHSVKSKVQGLCF
jgi:hypothetical protein